MRLNDSYSSAPLLQRRQDPLKGFSKAPDGVVTIPIFVYFLHFIFFPSQILGCSHGKPRNTGPRCFSSWLRLWLWGHTRPLLTDGDFNRFYHAKWWFNHQERRISPKDWGDFSQKWWFISMMVEFWEAGLADGWPKGAFGALSWFYQPIRPTVIAVTKWPMTIGYIVDGLKVSIIKFPERSQRSQPPEMGVDCRQVMAMLDWDLKPWLILVTADILFFLSQFTPHLSWFCLKIGHPPIFPWQTTAIAWGNVEPTGPDPACTLDVSTVELPASLPISAHDREIRSDFAILAFHKIALHMQIRAFFHSSRLRIFDVFFQMSMLVRLFLACPSQQRGG